VLAVLDALAGAVDAIEADGREELDPGPLSERLQQLVRTGTPDRRSGDERREEPNQERSPGRRKTQRRQSGQRRKPAPKTAAPPPPPADELELLAAVGELPDDGSRLLHVTATLSDQVMMPAARALMVLTALAEHGELVGSVPEQETVESFQGRQIDAWLVSSHEEDEISRRAEAVSDVVALTIVELDPSVAAAAEQVGEADVEEADAEEADAEGEPEPEHEAEPAHPAPAEQPTGGAGANSPARTVRVDAERLDALMHSMGELVIHRTAVEALTAGVEIPELQQAVQDLTRSSQALQAMVMQVRMIPVDIVFLRFPRLVRDLSTKLNKEVELKLTGKETELDRTVVDALGDPLVHLMRNALDHGLEHPEEREAAGKPRVGTVEIAARHAGGSVVIEVSDDGHGIDPQAVARKAVERGLIDADAADSIDMRGALELLFSAGFSMANVTTDLSGRGVGMDVVRSKIRELGGEVVMDSTPGVGTTAQIRLPLTLAIVAALQVDVAGAPFAIPLDRVERTLRLSPNMVRSVAGRRMLVLEDSVLPLLEGAATLGREPIREHELVVIIRGQDRRLGLAVDELVGQRELVTRPLPSVVSDGEPVSGGAVLADGRIALIVDCDALAQLILNSVAAGGASSMSSSGEHPVELAA